MAGSRIALALLIVASRVVATSILLDRFPEMTSELLARVTEGPAPDAAGGARHEARGHEEDQMSRRQWPWLAVVVLLLAVHAALAATSTVVLTVEGMT
jgi:hypothetical protein